MLKSHHLLLSLTLLFPHYSFATVGGPEMIEILGADIKDQKIYYLRHYHDESGRLPTLHYFLLNSKHSHQSIEVKSIYTPINSQNYLIKSQRTLLPYKITT